LLIVEVVTVSRNLSVRFLPRLVALTGYARKARTIARMDRPCSLDRRGAIERSGGFGHDYENDSVTQAVQQENFRHGL
jgi:hypothetical protein